MMSKFLRGLLSVSLCFCLICSICGVRVAAVDRYTDPAYWEMIGESPPPGIDDGEAVDPVVSAEPVVSPEPVVSSEPVVPSEPVEPLDPVPVESEYVDSGLGGLPGGDTPAYDPADLGISFPGDDTAGGSDIALVAPPGDVTYIELPEDYVIKSSSLDEMYAIDPQSALAPVTPSNTSGLKSVLLSILGTYDPIVAEYQYVNNGSYSNYIREIQPDYVWLSSAAIFAILLYSTWRLLGGLLCRK